MAINDPFGDAHTMAFLLKHDSVAGVIPNEVKETADGFSVDGREIAKLDHRDAGTIPWREHGVDVVIESTGLFTSRAKAAAHLDAGAKRVIISAPSNDADVTICLGVNDAAFDSAKHRVVSNASCTTNCLAPMARVLHERFGIEQGFVTTVHAYTGDQQLQDQAVVSRSGKVDLRRMRAAALSIIPSSTGAARAIGLVLPELNGKLDGLALRVPTPTGSVVDLVATLKVAPSVDEVNQAFVEASGDSSYHGYMKYTDEPLVSADIVGDDASVHLLGARHDGHGSHGEGSRLVRQRVGLLPPPRRPRRVRRQHLGVWRPSIGDSKQSCSTGTALPFPIGAATPATFAS